MILILDCHIVYIEGKHNRSEMVAVLGPYEALPYYIHTYIHIVYIDACTINYIHTSRPAYHRVYIDNYLRAYDVVHRDSSIIL
jgi:hypothetical protein